MGGGSWDYFYDKLSQVAIRLCADHRPIRKAFGVHLVSCALAMHEIEMVDSSDTVPGTEVDRIKAALGSAADDLILKQTIIKAKAVLTELQDAVAAAEKGSAEEHMDSD